MNEMGEVRLIAPDSDEYFQELALRDEILRKPLGMSIQQDDLSHEKADYHIGFFVGNQLTGVLVLTPMDCSMIKMRQVAVNKAFQRQGTGTALVKFAERSAVMKGYQKIVLNARKEAVPFYLKLDYEMTGGEFLEVGIPHIKLQKRLEQTTLAICYC